MDEAFDYQGKWCVPVSEEQWSGRLMHDPGRGTELEIIVPDRFDLLSSDLSVIPNVYGRTIDQLITLEDVQLIRSSMKSPGGTEATLRPQRSFIGAWFDPGEEVAFDRVVVRIEGVDEWAARTGFTHEMRPPGKFSVTYDVPDPEDVAIAGDVVVRLAFVAHTRPRGVPPIAFDLEQIARLELAHAASPAPYASFEDLVGRLRNFFMFVARRRVAVLTTTGDLELEVEDGSKQRGDVRIYTRAYGVAAPDRPKLLPHDLLFTARENRVGADSRLSRWLELSAEEDLGPVLNLYLVGLYQPRIFLEYQFLSLAQAAETLHARRFDTKLLPTAEHKANVKVVLELTGDVDLREWTRVRVQDANRKRFRQLFDELVAALPPKVRAVLPEDDLFAQKVMFTRNYHTHTSDSLADTAATSLSELFGLTRALRCVVEALLLIELGFSPDETELLLERNRNYMRELRTGIEAVDFDVLRKSAV